MPSSGWRQLRRAMLGVLTLGSAGAFVFFAYFGAQLLWFAATYRGEGSLGHVGMYIGAVLFPLLALLFGGLTWLGIRAWQRPNGRPGEPAAPPA